MNKKGLLKVNRRNSHKFHPLFLIVCLTVFPLFVCPESLADETVFQKGPAGLVKHGSGKNKLALLIGVQNFQIRRGEENEQLAPLPQLDNDIDEFATVLKFNGFEVHTLDTRSSEKPTRKKILRKVRELAQDASDDYLFLVYYTGHGIENYLCPWDYDPDYSLSFSGLNILDITRTIKSSKAKNKLLILDACHSGYAIEKREPSSSPGFRYETLGNDVSEGFNIITSCRTGENSFVDEKENMSYFTRYLVLGLAGEADGYNSEKRRNCVIDLIEIYNFLRQNVYHSVYKTKKASQRPNLMIVGAPEISLTQKTDDCTPDTDNVPMQHELEKLNKKMNLIIKRLSDDKDDPPIIPKQVLKKEKGEINISVNVNNVKIYIGGKLIGIAHPDSSIELLWPPGLVNIAAVKDGRSLSKAVQVYPDQKEKVAFSFQRPARQPDRTSNNNGADGLYKKRLGESLSLDELDGL